MISEIIHKIDSLPPLPESITKIEEFRRQENQEVEELVLILQDDAILVSTLLKVANSAMFGFRSKVETLKRLINLLGVKFTLYVAISESVQTLLIGDLKPYGYTTEDLKEANVLSVNLVNLWFNKTNPQLRDELILPSLLQRVGKTILAELIAEKSISDEFKKQIATNKKTSDVEKDLLGITTAQMTAMIFEHWKLNNDFVQIIKYIDDVENCESQYKQRCQILKVIKTICTPNALLDENYINEGLKLSDEFGLDTNSLKKAIKTLQDRALDDL